MSAEKNAPPLFVAWQSHLPTRLGISIEEVRARRDSLLTKGVHWQKNAGRVCWTEEGVALLAQSLSVALPANATAPPATPEDEDDTEPPPPAAASPEGPLVVLRSAPHIRNRRIVEVQRDGAGPTLLLWVKDNAAFRPGHRIPPGHVEARPNGQFTYIAGRPPR